MPVPVQRTYLRERFQHQQFESSLQIVLRHLALPLDNLVDLSIDLDASVCKILAPRKNSRFSDAPELRYYLVADNNWPRGWAAVDCP
jgi:hypothetical protein